MNAVTHIDYYICSTILQQSVSVDSFGKKTFVETTQSKRTVYNTGFMQQCCRVKSRFAADDRRRNMTQLTDRSCSQEPRSVNAPRSRMARRPSSDHQYPADHHGRPLDHAWLETRAVR